MLNKIKGHQGFQWLLQGINYCLSIGVFGSFIIGYIIGLFDLSLSDPFGQFYNFIGIFYPFVFLLFLTMGLLNFVFLDFKKNKLIFISFILNSLAWLYVVFGLLLIYWASV